jgi:hypothetical protein
MTDQSTADAERIRAVFVEAFRLSRSPWCKRMWLTDLMGRELWPSEQIQLFSDLIMAQRHNEIEPDGRLPQMAKMRANGESYASIGMSFGISGERVRQILTAPQDGEMSMECRKS